MLQMKMENMWVSSYKVEAIVSHNIDSAAKPPSIAVWGHTAYNMLWFSLFVVGPLPSAGGFFGRIISLAKTLSTTP